MSGLFERFKGVMTPEQLEQMRASAAALPVHPVWLALAQGLIAGATVNAVAGFGEELGWRGFLQNEFRRMRFWRSSLLIGLIWGFWHAPMILLGVDYPQHPVSGVFMMTIVGVLLAPFFSYVRLRAGSVIAAAIVHGTFNGTVGIPLMLIRGVNDLLVGSVGLAGLLALILLNLGLFIHDRFFSKNPIMT